MVWYGDGMVWVSVHLKPCYDCCMARALFVSWETTFGLAGWQTPVNVTQLLLMQMRLDTQFVYMTLKKTELLC